MLAAVNFIVIGLASAGVNPRVGNAANLGFSFLTFVVYFNLLLLGKSWIETGQVAMPAFMLLLHGGALALAGLWLAKRHFNWSPLRMLRNKNPNPRVPAA